MTGLGHEGVVRGGRWRSLAGAVALVAAALILVAGSSAQALPNRAYVTHVVPDVGTVSVIDTDTNAVVATVAVGDHRTGWPPPPTAPGPA